MYGFLEARVQDVMSKPLCVAPNTTLGEVEQLLEEKGYNGLPIVDQDEFVGFVTSLDLLRAFAFTEESMFPPYDEIMRRPVSGVMSPEPLTVRPRTPLTRVLQKMIETRNKSFPVIDADDHLVGIVAREDVLLALRRSDVGQALPAPR